MSDTKFTQGEWFAVGAWVEVESDEVADICSCNPDSIGQDHFNRSYEEQKANAALIAAAPDMYAALEACHEAMAYMSEYDIPLTLPDQVKAALAKARGDL